MNFRNIDGEGVIFLMGVCILTLFFIMAILGLVLAIIFLGGNILEIINEFRLNLT